MDLNLENLEHSGGGDDSNAVVLIPGNKRNKRKNADRESKNKLEKNKSLSKSHKRKLKKLEEEKERAVLFSKSLETLEKYKLPEDAYSLLQPSYNVGRVETALEKRRKVVAFSKAGLDNPYNDVSPKWKSSTNAKAENELDAENHYSQHNFVTNSVEPIVVEPNKLDEKFEEPVCGDEAVVDGVPAVVSQDKNTVDKKQETHEEDVNTDFSRKGGPSDSSLQEPLTTPIVVHVSRPEKAAETRKDLPIIMMEQEIMEAINYHSTVIICGETGCGKTTQLPQLLYEAGFGSKLSHTRSGVIGVTQPRRVAVLSTARRVAYELGLHLGREVGFQVRHDKQIGDNCSVKIMTDGILLREVQNDFLLKRYSVIILDEAHERSFNTDILIGMLSRVIRLRQGIYEKQQDAWRSGQSLNPEDVIFPLKLVLMSATMRVEDFTSGNKLFRSPPPVKEVPARQFKVTVHFSRKTEHTYILQAYKKVLSIHKKLPPGGILVFVTGQREVEYLCQKLRKASRNLVLNQSESIVRNETSTSSEVNSVEGVTMKEITEAFEMDGDSFQQPNDSFGSYDEDQSDDFSEDELDVSNDSNTESDGEIEILGEDGNMLDKESPGSNDNLLNVLGQDGNLDSLKSAFEALTGKSAVNSDSDGNENVQMTSEICSEHSIWSVGEEKREEDRTSPGALRVLPLYGMLPAAEQLRVVEDVMEGERLVVVATNVAETSLTIPGIKYVVDTGREKVKNYHPTNGMETYDIQFISKASAAQRAGRAGRTGPGHCYRLYSSAVFNNHMPSFSCPEISKMPVDGVVLLLKSMGIEKVANFPFPTPPEATALIQAEHCLEALQAIDTKGRLTPLGKAMAYYPISPRHSRMLLTAIQILKNVKYSARANLALAYAVAAAAALSLKNPFIREVEESQNVKDESEHGENTSISNSEKVGEKQEKLRKKKLKKAVRASRAKFLNPSSDALTIAYALQCFELSGNQTDFCNENALYQKTMDEMSKLRRQLLQLVFHQNKNFSDQNFSWTHGTLEEVEDAWRVYSDRHPILLNEEELLGQAICAGWADRVGKRIRGSSGQSDGDRKVRAVPYQACAVKETVFLDRISSLSMSAPEYLVYNELICSKHPYMRGATTVKPEWLIKFGKCELKPLADSMPYYEPQTDQVLCWFAPTFGPHLWQLPKHSLPIKKKADRAVAFAYALLEGQVLPCLKSVPTVAPPSSILRPEAAGQRRVGNLIAKFKKLSIDSCAVLRAVWKKSPKELYSEILDWFEKGFRPHFEELWSEMLREVFLEAQERYPRKYKRSKE